MHKLYELKERLYCLFLQAEPEWIDDIDELRDILDQAIKKLEAKEKDEAK